MRGRNPAPKALDRHRLFTLKKMGFWRWGKKSVLKILFSTFQNSILRLSISALEYKNKMPRFETLTTRVCYLPRSLQEKLLRFLKP